MRRPVIALAACGLVGACATPPAAQPQTATRQPASATAAKTEADKRVCVNEQLEDTGTRLGGRKTCTEVPEKEKPERAN